MADSTAEHTEHTESAAKEKGDVWQYSLDDVMSMCDAMFGLDAMSVERVLSANARRFSNARTTTSSARQPPAPPARESSATTGPGHISPAQMEKLQRIDMIYVCQVLPEHLLASAMLCFGRRGDGRRYRFRERQRHVLHAMTLVLRLLEGAHILKPPPSDNDDDNNDEKHLYAFVVNADWMNAVRDAVTYILAANASCEPLMLGADVVDDSGIDIAKSTGGGDDKNLRTTRTNAAMAAAYVESVDSAMLIRNTMQVLGNLYDPNETNETDNKSFNMERAYLSYHHRYAQGAVREAPLWPDSQVAVYQDEYSELVFPSAVSCITRCVEKLRTVMRTAEVSDSTAAVSPRDICEVAQGTLLHTPTAVLLQEYHGVNINQNATLIIVLCHCIDEMLVYLAGMLDIREVYSIIVSNNNSGQSDASDLLQLFLAVMNIADMYFEAKFEPVIGKRVRLDSQSVPFAARGHVNWASDESPESVAYSIFRVLIAGISCYSKLIVNSSVPRVGSGGSLNIPLSGEGTTRITGASRRGGELLEEENREPPASQGGGRTRENLYHHHVYDASSSSDVRYPGFMDVATSTDRARLLSMTLVGRISDLVARILCGNHSLNALRASLLHPSSGSSGGLGAGGSHERHQNLGSTGGASRRKRWRSVHSPSDIDTCLQFYLIRCCSYLADEPFARARVAIGIAQALADFLATTAAIFRIDEPRLASVWEAWAPPYVEPRNVGVKMESDYIESVRKLLYAKAFGTDESASTSASAPRQSRAVLSSSRFSSLTQLPKAIYADIAPPYRSDEFLWAPSPLEPLITIRLIANLQYAPGAGTSFVTRIARTLKQRIVRMHRPHKAFQTAIQNASFNADFHALAFHSKASIYDSIGRTWEDRIRRAIADNGGGRDISNKIDDGGDIKLVSNMFRDVANALRGASSATGSVGTNGGGMPLA